MMPACVVEITAPSRLHFGLLSFGQPSTLQPTVRQFGGVGAMISQPGLRLRISPAERFAVEGFLSDRARATIERIWLRMNAPSSAKPQSRALANKGELACESVESLPACRIEVLESPREHVGLGTGTQLSLALAAGLNALVGRDQLEPAELAAVTGRGERSAVGTYGFVQGGLIVETGKAAGETLSPLYQRVELPEAWRFVLICPRDQSGLSGEAERRAFGELPPVRPEISAQLLGEVLEQLLPAAVAREFDRFSESLYRYGHAAGECFAGRQGGAFASARAAELVARIRALGVAGVGQSSWGPTLFALLPNAADANNFLERLRPHLSAAETALVAEPNNSGARIQQSAP